MRAARDLQLTAEHAILLALALGKRLIEADDAVRKDRWDATAYGPDHNVAYNWAASPISAGCSARPSASSGSARSARSRPAWRAGFGTRVLYCNRNRLPAAQGGKARRRIRADRPPACESDFVSLHATNIPENRGLIGRRNVRRHEADRVLHQHGARAYRGRRRAVRRADQRHHRGRRPRRSHHRAAPNTGPPCHIAERDPHAAHRGWLAQGRDAGDRGDPQQLPRRARRPAVRYQGQHDEPPHFAGWRSPCAPRRRSHARAGQLADRAIRIIVPFAAGSFT
jgi:hypothetical protein